MTETEAMLSLRRVFAFFNANPIQEAEYVSAVTESCGWMPPERFELVCKTIVCEIQPGRRPLPVQYVALYHRLAEQRGWKLNNRTKCLVCDGMGYNVAFLKRKDTGVIYEGVTNCLSCRGVDPVDPRLELVSQEEHDAYWREYR